MHRNLRHTIFFILMLFVGHSYVGTTLVGFTNIAGAQPLTRPNAIPEELQTAVLQAASDSDYSKILELTKEHAEPTSWAAPHRANAFQARGQERFFAGKIAESIEDFDAFLKIFPASEPHHWQRGISYYYAEEFAAGKAQFENHQEVNTQDVENAVWHFLCAARIKKGSVESARKKLIPIDRDSRVPMKQIHELFAGKGTAEDVITASQSRNDKCYAHLYLGLYYEALGKAELAKKHIELAANDFRMDHYMGKVAQVHAKLRGWQTP